MEHAFSDRQAFIGLLIVGLLAIVGAQPRLVRWGQRLGLSALFTSRLHFLFAGLFLSETGIGALNNAIVRELDALVTLGLGILGLLLGLRGIGRRPDDRRIARAAGIETLATLLLVGGPFFFLLELENPMTLQQRAVAAGLIGCTAAISGRRLFTTNASIRHRHLRGINEVADLDTMIGVLAAGILLALLSAAGGISPLEKLLALAVIGVIGGLSAWLLASPEPGGKTQPEPLRVALLLGVLLVTAGAATHMGLPPVAATLVMGLTIAHLPGTLASELSESLAFLESPLRALLLVMAGAALTVPTGTALIIVVLFLALRTAGKILGGRVGSTVASDVLPAKMGLGLLPSSAVALGLALDFQATAPSQIARVVVTTAVLGSLLSETAGVWTTRMLARAYSLSEAALDKVSDLTRPEPRHKESTH